MHHVLFPFIEAALFPFVEASLGNAKDLGEWIGATSHGLFNFPPPWQSLHTLLSHNMQRVVSLPWWTCVHTQVLRVVGYLHEGLSDLDQMWP